MYEYNEPTAVFWSGMEFWTTGAKEIKISISKVEINLSKINIFVLPIFPITFIFIVVVLAPPNESVHVTVISTDPTSVDVGVPVIILVELVNVAHDGTLLQVYV